VSTTPAPVHAGAYSEALPRELCPLCGEPLRPEQNWCLRCGAAARTRLAAQPKWKGLVIALLFVIVLSLGVLAAALVKLAG
jgi:predicted amidophosphoribosyltransferase